MVIRIPSARRARLVPFAAAAFALGACAPRPQPVADPTDAPPVLRSIMTADFPLRAALHDFDSHAHRYTLTGTTKQGEHLRVRFTIAPRGRIVFEGARAEQSRLSYAVDRDGDVIARATYTEYTAVDGGATLGSAGDGRYVVVTLGGLLPEHAGYGAHGVYFRANEYASPAKAAVLQTHVASYVLEHGDDVDNTHARLCLRYETSGSAAVETHCFKLDRAGDISDPQIRFAAPGLDLTLR